MEETKYNNDVPYERVVLRVLETLLEDANQANSLQEEGQRAR